MKLSPKIENLTTPDTKSYIFCLKTLYVKKQRISDNFEISSFSQKRQTVTLFQNFGKILNTRNQV
jgi:hypothetical protein